jgi:hypothetical protein
MQRVRGSHQQWVAEGGAGGGGGPAREQEGEEEGAGGGALPQQQNLVKWEMQHRLQKSTWVLLAPLNQQ